MKIDTIEPYFSVIILHWNNGNYLFKCLDYLNQQTFDNFEVLLVNNGVPDIENKILLTKFPDLIINQISLKENVGFAAGNNLAVRYAKGKYIALLNADAFAEPDWLKRMYEATNRYPESFLASRLVMANQPTLLDGEGDNYHASGLAWRKSYGMLLTKSNLKEKAVFSACGAAAIYPKLSYEKVGGFDEDFFSYYEDVDIGFRLRLLGLNCFYIPTAVVHHIGSASTGKRSNFAIYHGQRNLVWTFIKDMPGIFIWILLPYHITANFFMLLASLFRGEVKIVFRAKIDAITKLPEVLKKRERIQAARSITATQIVKLLDWNPLSPLIKLNRR